jgi:hypothetical protein
MIVNEFRRGDLALVRSTSRTVQVHRVRDIDGRTMLDCRSTEGRSEDDGLYRPGDLIPCAGLKPILPPE